MLAMLALPPAMALATTPRDLAELAMLLRHKSDGFTSDEHTQADEIVELVVNRNRAGMPALPLEAFLELAFAFEARAVRAGKAVTMMATMLAMAHAPMVPRTTRAIK